MKIKGHKFISGKTVPRKWGTEYRYTVVSENDGVQYDDVVEIPSKAKEEEIASIIEKKLDLISVRIPVPSEPEKEIDEIMVLKYLKEKLIIKEKHTMTQIKTAMSSVASNGR